MSEPTSAESAPSSMWADLKYLIGTFDRRSRWLLVVNVFVQFLVALMDLLGLAAIYPLMQVALGSSIDSGTVGDIHRLFGNQPRNDFAITLAALMGLSFLAKAALASFLVWWSLGLVTKLQTRTSRRLLERYMSETYLEHRKRNVGEVMRAVGSATAAAHSNVLGGLLALTSAMLSVVFIAGLLLVVTPVAAICAAVYFAVAVFLIQRLLAPANRRAGEVAQFTSWVMSKSLMEAMQGFREAHLHGATGYFVRRYDEANIDNAQASRKANFLAQLPKNLLEFVTMIGLTVLIVVSVVSGNAQSTMPALSLFVGATVKILPLMISITATFGMIRYGRDGLKITVQALKEMQGDRRLRSSRSERDEEQPSVGAPLPDDASLDARGVSFRYDAESPNVLEDIDLHIPAGSSLALCGPSGSGKTTLVDILLGLIEPTQGRVTYGGLRTADHDPRWLDAVAYVPQDVYLMDDTLANNVAFGIPPEQQDGDKIRRCLERAEMGDVLASLPEGIDTPLGERGTRLSGGQRQRIGIARALYRDPKVIVLDEATSALDNATEHKITKTVNSLRGDITTVIVAHRLSTVRNVDALAFLQNGHIEALGTFAQVEAQSPTFARLVQLGRLDGADDAAVPLDA